MIAPNYPVSPHPKGVMGLGPGGKPKEHPSHAKWRKRYTDVTGYLAAHPGPVGRVVFDDRRPVLYYREPYGDGYCYGWTREPHQLREGGELREGVKLFQSYADWLRDPTLLDEEIEPAYRCRFCQSEELAVTPDRDPAYVNVHCLSCGRLSMARTVDAAGARG